MTDPTTLQGAFEIAMSEFDHVNVVMCNAGLARFPRFVDVALEDDLTPYSQSMSRGCGTPFGLLSSHCERREEAPSS